MMNPVVKKIIFWFGFVAALPSYEPFQVPLKILPVILNDEHKKVVVKAFIKLVTTNLHFLVIIYPQHRAACAVPLL